MTGNVFDVVPTALDVSVVQHLGVGALATNAQAVAVEEGAGGRGGRGAGLGGPGIELGDLEVAVAGVGHHRHVADRRVERAVARIHAGEDPLVVAHDQPRLAGQRIDERHDLVHVGRGS